MFVATKLGAFKGRGGGDYYSHDLEDAIAVIDSRETLCAEVRREPPELREFLRVEIGQLLATAGFLNALPGLLFPDAASQARIGIVIRRLRDLALQS